MGLKAFVIAQAIIAILKDTNKKGLILELADKIDAIADRELGKRSEETQSKVVEVVLLPLSKALLKENPIEFNRLVTNSLIEIPAEKPRNGESGKEAAKPERGNHGNFGGGGSK